MYPSLLPRQLVPVASPLGQPSQFVRVGWSSNEIFGKDILDF